MANVLKGRLEQRPLASGEVSWVARVAGRKETLGQTPEMEETEARRELAYMVERVRRGAWKSKQRNAPAPPPKPAREPDVRALATDFLANLATQGVGGAQLSDLQGLIKFYVLRHLRRPDGTWPTPSQLSVVAVEELRTALQREREELDRLREAGVTRTRDGKPLPRGLGPRRVNRAIRTLFRVLDYAAPRHGTPSARELRDADLMISVTSREGPHLTCGQVVRLLEAAAEQERTTDGRTQHIARVAPLAVLALGGLRLGELCELRLMDVDTSRARWAIKVRKSKTAAGEREVPVVGYLRPILAAHIARRQAEGARPRDPLFATRSGKRISADNFRRREYERAARAADELCAQHGLPPIPGIAPDADEDEVRATPHALRRTYITHMAERGVQPRRLMRWVGHRDAKLTIEVYERVEDREDEDPLLPVLYGDEQPGDGVVVMPVDRVRER